MNETNEKNVWSRVARSRLTEVAVWLLAVASVARLAWVLPARVFENDFAHYYVTGKMMAEGEGPYGRPLAPYYARDGFRFEEDVPVATNPPTLVWLFAPLARLAPPTAFWIWVAVQGICLVAILWFIRQLLREQFSVRGWRLVWAATICSGTVYWHFFYGQWQLLLAALVLGALVLLRRGKGTAACLVVAAAGAIKLFPFFLLPWFLWRSDTRWLGRLARAVGVGCGLVVVGWLTDGEQWQAFLSTGLSPLTEHAINRSSTFTVPALLTDLGYAAYGFQPPPGLARLWWLIGVTAGLVLLVGAYVFCLRSRGGAALQFSLLSVALLVGMFKSEPHYLVFAIFPLAVVAAQVVASPTRRGVIGFGVLLLAVNCLETQASPFLDRHIYLKVVANFIPLYALLALGGWLGRAMWRESQERGQ